MLKLKRHKINILIRLLVAFLCIFPTMKSSAASTTTVTQSWADEKEVYLFVDGIYEDIVQINGYIGSQIIPDIKWEWVRESETEIKTLILMDTSLSVKSEIKEHFKEMLRALAENKLPNESIAIATYGKTPKYLCDYQSDTEALLQVIDSINYQKQNSFLYQSIYDIVTDFNELNDRCLKRIVIFSDGDDTNSEGVSKTEVLTLLDKTSYPVYAVGCAKETNADSLKDFFALSRITGAKSLKFGLETAEEEVESFFASIGDYQRIRIVPPTSVMDGGMKNIALEIVTISDVYQVSADVRVGRVVTTEPDVEDVEEPVEEPSDVSREEPEDEPEAVATKAPEAEEPETVTENKSSDSFVKLIAIVVLILAVAGLVIYFVLKRGSGKKTEDGPIAPQAGQSMAAQPVVPIVPQEASSSSAYMGSSCVQEAEYHGLEVILEDTVSKRNVSIRLSDYAEGRFIAIGRNREKCDVTIDYDGGISQLHCVMYMSGNSIFVEDCQSTNHTYLNGNQIVEAESIAEDDVLTLGKVKFIVHILLR